MLPVACTCLASSPGVVVLSVHASTRGNAQTSAESSPRIQRGIQANCAPTRATGASATLSLSSTLAFNDPHRKPKAHKRYTATHAQATAGAAARDTVLDGRSVAVVGGGPAGMLAAAHLARLGARVQVYERLSEQDQKIPPTVWGICLGKIAADAMTAAGLSPEFDDKWKSAGASSHMQGSQAKFIGRWVGEDRDSAPAVYSTQPNIVAHLRRECEREYGAERIAVENRLTVVGGDVRGGGLVLESADGERREREFDLVVVADGASSRMRSLMAETDPALTVDLPKSQLQFLPLSLTPQGDPTTYKNLPTPSGDPVHLVPLSVSAPCRGTSTSFFRASPDADSGILMLLFTVWAGGEQVGALVGCSDAWFTAQRSTQDTQSALEAAFPDVPKIWIQEIAEVCVEGARRPRTVTFVSCSKLGSGRAVIVGDAAHAISPNIAAGCNASLQDASVLARSIAAVGGDLDRIAQQYTAERLADVQAITRISRQIDDVLCYGFHGDLGRTLRGVPIMVTLVLSALPKESSWPGFLRPPASFTTMMQTSEHFSKVEEDSNQLFIRLVGTLAAVLATSGAALQAVF